MTVLLIGTLDTKSAEVRFVREHLNRCGAKSIVMDASVLGEPAFAADIARETVFAAAGKSWEQIRRTADRGQAIAAAAEGAARLSVRLHQEGKITAVFGLGGSAGTTIGTAAMRALPYGVPKLMVSTLASGQVSPYVGVRDILMLHSVVDFCGLNRFSRLILGNAANAMAGMVSASDRWHQSDAPTKADDRPLVAASMFGVTTPCVERARQQVEAAGFEVLVFHATGTGGKTMEAMIREGQLAGVLDFTTTELADELVGGILTAGKDRLTAAAIRGVPQAISLGALDMVNFGPPESVPERFQERRFYQHNPNVTLMRTTPEENDRLGKEIAEKASASRGPTAVFLPLRGVSAIDKEGGPFWWPEADQALFQSIRNWAGPWVKVVELDFHINDSAFADACARWLLERVSV